VKPIRERTHYELLEVPATATLDEIRASFERLNQPPTDEQVAASGLAEAAAHQALHERRKEALEVLGDGERRAAYDRGLASSSHRPSPGAAPAMAEGAAIDLAEQQVAMVHQRAAEVREARAAAASSPARDSKPKMVAIPPDAAFTGELLRKIRQAKGINLQQLAEKTRIGLKHLENVEAEKYEALPAAVYLRGILMNLCKELGLDGIKVSRQYLERVSANRAKG
jgi:curved DNA-binding protein CbpA